MMGVVLALALGGSQPLSRSLFSQMIRGECLDHVIVHARSTRMLRWNALSNRPAASWCDLKSAVSTTATIGKLGVVERRFLGELIAREDRPVARLWRWTGA